MRTPLLICLAVCMTGALALLSSQSKDESVKRKKPTPLTAGKALADWHAQRSFPGKKINMKSYSESFEQFRSNALKSNTFTGQWEPIGPMNFGGRTLTLCFNPQNTNTIYAGSASGGLWRTRSFANGATAWHRVATGFPVLGVAAIVINPLDTNIMYIGTGEVYSDQNTGTGFSVRTTRGTYGIGILKSTDGGASWSKSLDWAYSDLKGVQDLLMNPLNPSTIFAATTEGTYRSLDDGITWTLVNNTRMATDLLMVPGDTSVVFIAAGNSFSANPGIYRSADGGSNFTKITSGLPFNYSGKAMLDICNGNTQIMYASIAEQLSGLGLYRSDNQGLNWYQVNPTDFQTYQGWYSHDVSVNPGNPNDVITCGIDVWRSIDGGTNLNQVTYWYNWDFNDTTVGGNEGPPDYVHADIHKAVRHPYDSMIVFLATDGGIFRSVDGGSTFVGRNGGYQTQQFYANFSSSNQDSLFAIGGMQDNATAVYEGNPGWRRVIGGDGLSTAIHPSNDNIVYGSSQYLNVRRSTDKAQSFSSVGVPGGNGAVNTNFAGPYVMCKSSPTTLYAGRMKVYKTTNGGNSWSVTNNDNELDGNAVLVLEASSTNPNLVFAATAPANIPQTGLVKTTNGGTSWTNVTSGIPNRYIMDIAIDPVNNQIVYVTVGGFGTPHLFRSLNGGTTWSAWGTGLPDVPANTITIDPLNNQIIYLGNDLGIFASIDGGASWQPFNEGIDDGILVMDISVSPSNRKLRLATHGLGIYERDMLPVSITGIDEEAINQIGVFPNPATDFISVTSTAETDQSEFHIIDKNGRVAERIMMKNGTSRVAINGLASGVYFLVNPKQPRSAFKFVKL